MYPKLPTGYKNWVSSHLASITPSLKKSKSVHLNTIWKYFKKSETLLMHYHDNKIYNKRDGNTEFGLTLFALNYLIHKKSTEIFLTLGMPHSSISPEIWGNNQRSTIRNLPLDSIKRVDKDGTLFLDIPYAQFDPGWAISGICYLFRELGLIQNAEFKKSNTVLTPFSDRDILRIAIIGDWGTGGWEDGEHQAPAVLIANAIKQLQTPPEIVIHLGDVYYSGLISEEDQNLVKDFPSGIDSHNFTLNSNHEVYNGSNGYFNSLLKTSIFPKQKGSSYFAIKYKNWIIICLDSAYFDKSIMVMNGSLGNNNNTKQKDFIKSLKISSDQKIILFTHHPGVDYSGRIINENLVNEIYDALGGIYPDYWYYGHIHNGVVYNENSVIGDPKYQTRFKTHPRLRCVGHSGIPFGKADLRKNTGVDYYARTSFPNPDENQKLRVLNGFAIVSLSQQKITEEMYEVSPTNGAKVIWKKIQIRNNMKHIKQKKTIAKCNFTFTFSGTADELYKNLKNQVDSNGGTLNGDASSGNFDVPVMGNSIAGSYSITGQQLSVQIDKKPGIISCQAIGKYISDHIN